MWCVWVSSVARSCATRDASNKDNVCEPTIPAGINRPPPSETISHVTRVPNHKTSRTSAAGGHRGVSRDANREGTKPPPPPTTHEKVRRSLFRNAFEHSKKIKLNMLLDIW